jgi:hypothetical protein
LDGSTRYKEAFVTSRRDIDNLYALDRVLRDMQQPAVPRPTEPIIRTEAVRKHNRHGCVVGSAESVAADPASRTPSCHCFSNPSHSSDTKARAAMDGGAPRG